MTDKKHGGKRSGAGRPATGQNETAVIRVDVVLVPIISEIKSRYRKTKSVEDLINVTTNQDGKLLAANEKLRIRCDKLSVANIEKNGEINLLKSQISELERVAALDGAVLDDFIAKRDGKQGAKQSSDNGGYDGNAKGFKAALVSILGNDNNVVSALRKKAYAVLNIQPMGNGKLKSDSERVAVYEWLKDKYGS